MIRLFFFAGLSFVFLSCLSIESKMTLAADGSGTLELEYTVSSFAQDWDSRDSGSSPLPLPVNEADFRRGVNSTAGLSLVSYSRRAAADSTVITAVVGFRSLEALNSFVSRRDAHFTVRQEGGRTVFEQILTQGTRGELGGQTKGFVEAFFGPYSLKFALTAPAAVSRSTPAGSVSGRTASVSFPLPAVVGSREPVIWRVEW
ncbi:MAG: hypothetical protein FWG35_08595 [Spirochaetaceae bacterium]|nr:hypothetical protein [Spirochaetaceae bacterium]